MVTVYKLTLIFTLNLLLSVPLYAKVVEQKNLSFPIQSEKLLSGEVHTYFSILTPRKLAVQYPELFNLDSLSLNQENGVVLVVSKSVSVVSKPVGFFDDKQMVEEKFVSHVLGEQKVSKLSPDSFKVTVPGSTSYSYKMQSFFDADDVSTLPNSKVIRAVTAARNLDVISKSASTIMFSEKTNYSKYVEGGVTVSSFIALKETKTMIITYNLYAVQKKFALPKVLRQSFHDEALAVKGLVESYK